MRIEIHTFLSCINGFPQNAAAPSKHGYDVPEMTWRILAYHLSLQQTTLQAARDSRIYFSMASLLGQDRLYSRLVGSGAPERRLIAQSQGLWSGSHSALCLMKTS